MHFPDHETINGFHWRGYAWLEGKAWTPADHQDEHPAELLARLNGCFSWAGHWQGKRFAATDRLGSYPVFYGKGTITDRLDPHQLNIQPRWLNLDMWKFVEALPACHTLDDEFFSVPPYHLLWMEENGQSRLEAVEHYAAKPARNDMATGPDFERIVLDCCQRLIEYANGRTVVVLLSDGYDSRLLLAALKKLACPQLVAATYGIAGNGVVERAKAIAARLEVPFHFIDYGTPEHADFMLKAYPQIVRLAANGQSVPQEQELFAAERLSKLLPPDSILVPGISGDLQAGSYVPPYSFRWPPNRRPVPLLRWLRTRLTRIPNGSSAARAWGSSIELKINGNSEAAAVAATERVIVHERLNKYLCTTLRGYEMAGFDWYLPLWDKAFLDFWNACSIVSRRFRTDYRQWCKARFFVPADIHFTGEGERPRIHLGRILRRFLPFGDRLAGGVPDPNAFSNTIAPLVGKAVPSSEVNAALGEWLIDYYRSIMSD